MHMEPWQMQKFFLPRDAWALHVSKTWSANLSWSMSKICSATLSWPFRFTHHWAMGFGVEEMKRLSTRGGQSKIKKFQIFLTF